MRKVVKKVEEPKKEEVKRTKVKIAKPKKYEELPEIPDYERPELEKYEETPFELGKPSEKAVATPGKVSDQGVESTAATPELSKNGLPKVLCPSVFSHLHCIRMLFVMKSTKLPSIIVFALPATPFNYMHKKPHTPNSRKKPRPSKPKRVKDLFSAKVNYPSNKRLKDCQR